MRSPATSAKLAIPLIPMRFLSARDRKEAWICVCGKGRRQTRLPMTQEVGDALASYISQARHPSDTDALFIRSRSEGSLDLRLREGAAADATTHDSGSGRCARQLHQPSSPSL